MTMFILAAPLCTLTHGTMVMTMIMMMIIIMIMIIITTIMTEQKITLIIHFPLH